MELDYILNDEGKKSNELTEIAVPNFNTKLHLQKSKKTNELKTVILNMIDGTVGVYNINSKVLKAIVGYIAEFVYSTYIYSKINSARSIE